MIGSLDAPAVTIEAVHARLIRINEFHIRLGRHFKAQSPIHAIDQQPPQSLIFQIGRRAEGSTKDPIDSPGFILDFSRQATAMAGSLTG
jgi:hypothetical protein